METIQACTMLDVVLCQHHLPGVEEKESQKKKKQQQQYTVAMATNGGVVGRTRRRRVTGGVVGEETEPPLPEGGSDRVESMENMVDGEEEEEPEFQQREKEPKKELDEGSEHAVDVEKQVTHRIVSLEDEGDRMQVEVVDDTETESERNGQGEPVPPPVDAVREQLRNLSPIEPMEETTINNLLLPGGNNSGFPEFAPNGSVEIPNSPEATPPARPAVNGGTEKDQQHNVGHVLEPTSRHSWHVDKETQIE